MNLKRYLSKSRIVDVSATDFPRRSVSFWNAYRILFSARRSAKTWLKI